MFLLDNIWQIFIGVFFIVVAVLTLFLPIFVMQIRESARRIEKQLAEIVERL